jgi:hypothetical protein
VHLSWDPVADSPLFTETFFVQDYLIEVWAPGQVYRLRQNAIPIGPHGVSVNWAYTLEMNADDQINAGQPGARRDLSFYVWARTNTGRISLDPAHITVTNPPPDMSEILPDCTGLVFAAKISFNQYVPPRDFAFFQMYLDTVNPPIAIYQGLDVVFRVVTPVDLVAGVTYYTYILPFDSFGPGIPSQTASFMAATTLESLDTTPPEVPSGFALTTGTSLGTDGTVIAYVEATWTLGIESDLAGYEVHFRVAPSLVPTVFSVGHQNSVRLLSVPGNVTVFAKLAAYDRVHNISEFGPEISITTARDTVPPFAPTNLTAIGSIKSVALLWTPPPDPDYAYAQVWSATVNNRASAVFVGTGLFNFIHEGLGPTDTRYYWIRSVDTSGNLSVNFTPSAAAAGIAGTAGQLDTTYISSLAATKIISGTIQALVNIGVANIALDGVNSLITIHDSQSTPVTRVLIGKLGFLSDSYGMRIFNPLGQMMWNLTDGVQTEGISDRSITAPKIEVGAIIAEHLTTTLAVITNTAQIATAIIHDAHIIDVSADKINAGTIDALLRIGVGPHVNIDGVNTNMSFYDNQGSPALRVVIGKVGSATTDYGLQIWSASGQLMWNFTDGAQTAGLAPSSVITEKIIVNAVTESVQFATGSTLTTTTLVTQVASVTIPTLLAGDDVWIHGCCEVSVVGGGSSVALDLLENGIGGTNLQRATLNTNATLLTTMLNVPTVYIAGGTLSNKTFVLVTTAVVGTVIENVRLIARRVKR